MKIRQPYYPTDEIMKKIKRAKVNVGKLSKDEDFISKEYESFKIKRFYSRKEFLENSDNKKDALKQWKYIKKRDLLLKTGQYRDIRNRIYKKNYILVLEKRGLTKEDKTVLRLSKLSAKKISELDLIGLLPPIKEMYNTDNDEERENILEELQNAIDYFDE